MITKKELTNVLGLSCVERYFAAWFGKFADVTKLYADSFVGINQVFDDFMQGVTYQNYCYITRLQDTAEDYGMVTHKYIPCQAQEALKILKSASENALCLARVNTSFFTEFKRSSWREDHYVCVDGGLNWINEYPLAEGKFIEERFGEVYDGALCVYESADVSAQAEDNMTGGILAQKFGDLKLPGTLAAVESAVGVLRITRKRMEKFYAANERVKEILTEENKLLDKIYFFVRLRQIKQMNNEKTDLAKAYEEICKSVNEAAEMEMRIKEVLGK